jgi:Tfp pilus assembly protein FimT
MRRRAFTLVESIMVIVITMILTAASFAGLRGVQTWRATAAVRRVQSDLLYARSAAMLSGRRTLCVFDTSQNRYTLQQEANPPPAGSPVAIVGVTLEHPVTGSTWQVALNDLANGLTMTFPSGFTPTEIGFDVSGLMCRRMGSTMGKDVTLTLGSAGTVTVRGSSGLSEVSYP